MSSNLIFPTLCGFVVFFCCFVGLALSEEPKDCQVRFTGGCTIPMGKSLTVQQVSAEAVKAELRKEFAATFPEGYDWDNDFVYRSGLTQANFTYVIHDPEWLNQKKFQVFSLNHKVVRELLCPHPDITVNNAQSRTCAEK